MVLPPPQVARIADLTEGEVTLPPADLFDRVGAAITHDWSCGGHRLRSK